MRIYDIIFCNSFKGSCNHYYIMPYFHFFVWNNYKRELIKINGTFCSEYKWSYHYHQSLNLFNNEYVQANYQKYNFTYQDHIYEKNHKIYQYNNETLKFDEIEYHENIKLSCEQQTSTCIIGEGELCKECDINEPEFCGSCNEDYYLTNDDRTKCVKVR